jgi:hypothetical protein
MYHENVEIPPSGNHCNDYLRSIAVMYSVVGPSRCIELEMLYDNNATILHTSNI